LQTTGIDWRESRLINKWKLDQRVKLKLDQEETKNLKIGRGVRQGCFFPILWTYSEYINKEALGEF
jgi:hypothetical protein